MADIESIVKDLVAKLTGDSALLEAFKKDPVNTIKQKLGVNISEDQIQAVIKAVSAKLGIKKAGGFLAKIKGLFGK